MALAAWTTSAMRFFRVWMRLNHKLPVGNGDCFDTNRMLKKAIDGLFQPGKREMRFPASLYETGRLPGFFSPAIPPGRAAPFGEYAPCCKKDTQIMGGLPGMLFFSHKHVA